MARRANLTNAATAALMLLCCESALSQENARFFSRQYTMQEVLDAKDPREERPLQRPVKAFFINTINQMAADQANQDQYRNIDNEVNDRHEEHQARLMTGQFDEKIDSRARFNRVSHGFVRSTSSYGKRSVATKVGVQDYFDQGVQFELDLSSPLPKEAETAKRPDTVKYGLVVQEITPAVEKRLQASNHAGIRDHELPHAPKAEVHYTIGPKTAPLPLAMPTSASPWSGSAPADEKFVMPSTKLKGQVKTKTSPAEGAPQEEGNLPPMVATLSQEDNLLRVEYHTKSDFEKEMVRHGVTLPLAGTVHMDREMDEHFNPTRTSAKDLLYDEHAPHLDVHYHNQEKAYESDLRIEKASYSMNVKAKSASPVLDEGPKYEVGFSKNF